LAKFKVVNSYSPKVPILHLMQLTTLFVPLRYIYTMIRALLLFHIFFYLLAGMVLAQGPGHTVKLKSGTIEPTANANQWLAAKLKAQQGKEPVLVMIHFNSLPTKAERETLKQEGITLYDYLPENTFTAFVRFPLDAQKILALPIHSFIDMKPEWKADDFLWKKISNEKGLVEVLVSFFPGIDNIAARQFVSILGGQVNPGPMEKYGSYKVVINASKVRSMAQWYGVQYISPISPIVALDNQSMPVVKSNLAADPTQYGGYGLNGDGVTVGVGDNSSGIFHIDLSERITNFNPGTASLHGQIVNGIVGAAGILDPFAYTLTPHVALVDHLFDNILPATGAMYNDYNMTIANNSYTIIEGDCSYAGTYDIYSHFLDTLSIEFPNVQHVFASGNDGHLTCSPYLQGFATVGGGYQPAKNNIVVGSITDYLADASDESRGPVKDGRLKPEIVAVGLGTYSCAPGNSYAWSAGTSMASPQVAGGLAALTQRFKQIYFAQPGADVLKAILLNGAMDLGNPGPDYTYGFGSMDLYRSLQIINNDNFTTNTLNDGDSMYFTITIPPNTGQLKVMLCWNDAPGNPGSSVALVNDIDLSVTDPSSAIHLPLILNPSPDSVNNNATESPDHLNNVEQVVITRPPAGAYVISAKGFHVPVGPQDYAIAFDIIPDSLHLTGPLGGESFPNMTGDSIRIFWDAITDGHTFTAQFSADNGATWTTLSDSLSPDSRNCDFLPIGLNSGNCMVRISKNGTTETVTSSRFAVNTAPVITPGIAQCPGYINIHWSPVPNASGYYLIKKNGLYMEVADSVTDTLYSFSGMPINTPSFVAVQPVFNGLPGYRSLGYTTTANTGNCTNSISNGDLMIDKIVSPGNGRIYTSTQFTTGTDLKVEVRNLYLAACSNYTLSWQINGGPWGTLISPRTIPANDTAVISIPGISFTFPTTYNLTLAITNTTLPDPQPSNDTILFTIVNIPNNPLNLAFPFSDGFEDMGRFGVTHDSVGVSPNGHWDFFDQNDSGRMRSFVSDDITITGSRSVSLDEIQNVSAGSNNTFVGTFNLSSYDTFNSEVRVDFDYILHGTPQTTSGNTVMARGNDTAAWMPLFNYNLNAYPGFVTHVQSLSLTDALISGNRNFSTSTQVSFGQNDTSLIASVDYGNGITLDNFRMYTVANDAQMVNVVSPAPTNCGLADSVPLTVQVHNGVNYTLYNIQLYFNLDNGPTYTGIIDSIQAKGSVNYSFSKQMNLSPGIDHSLNVWLSENRDSYHLNDSILNYAIRNSVIISSYPYLENFESGNGGYFSGGYLDSWQYGVPASPNINRAASGTHAWKTNLTGNYNNFEKSYLYSPCFDLSSLTNPMLSFSAAIATEDCGSTLCDAAWIEYSYDGLTWTKLGSAGQGTNWYEPTFEVWSIETFTRWHVASIPLPKPGAGQTTLFRFVLASDPAVNFEGIAVDDIHIYDYQEPICPPDGNIDSVQLNLTGNQWVDFVENNKLIATLQPNNQNISELSAALYTGGNIANPGATQYTFSRNYTLKSPQNPADSLGVRIYLTDSEFVNALNDTTCASCAPVSDAYRLGVTQFTSPGNRYIENATLKDDTGGSFTYFPWQQVKWVPYDKGYYAEINTLPWSEYWFNNGGPTGVLPAGKDYLSFEAYKTGHEVTVFWYSLIDTAVDTYIIQRSTDGVNFTNLTDTIALHVNPAVYTYIDNVNFNIAAVYYYRLMWNMTGQKNYYYSPIRRVDFSDSSSNLITFTAQMASTTSVAVNWNSSLDIITDHYVLDRAIGSNPYTTLETLPAQHIQNLQYYYTDPLAGLDIANGSPIHYKLTAFLQNNSMVNPPVQTLDWATGTAIISLFPNPTHDGNLNLIWTADTGTVMHLEMFDALGRKAFETSIVSTQWYNTAPIQASGRYRGVYFIRIDIGGKKFIRKVVWE